MMTQEEFQKLVIEKLVSVESAQQQTNIRLANLEQGQIKLEQRQTSLEDGQAQMQGDIKALHERFDRLERIQNDDTKAIIELIMKKSERLESAVNILNTRLFSQEIELNTFKLAK